MRSFHVQDSDWEEADAGIASSCSAEMIAVAAEAPAAWTPPEKRWCDQRSRLSWPGVGIALGCNALLLTALVTMDVVVVPFAKRDPTVVTLVALPNEPPPAAAPPETKVEPVKIVQTPIVAPPPLVQTPVVKPVQVVTAPEPAPVKAVVVAQAPAAPSGPVSVGDLDSKMVVAKPPKYPIESRKKREQGTVVLTVLLSTAGTVADVSVSRSSGFDRLDRAALEAVRRWKWSPTVQSGQAVMVKGIVEIPFVLSA